MTLAELKKILKTGKVIFGKDRTLKSLKQGKIKQVFVSSNCSFTEDVEYYAKLSKSKVSKLKIPNDELGIVCKKPFSVSVIGVE